MISLIFFLFNILPGDASRLLLGQRGDQNSVEMIRKDLGLDKPIHTQYFKYLNDLSFISIHNKDKDSYFSYQPESYTKSHILFQTKNKVLVLKSPYLRRSFQTKKLVAELIKETFPNTMILALTSIVIASIIGILWGIFAARFKDSIVDRISIFISALGMSLPSFFAAIIIAWIFAFLLHDLTGLNLTGNLFEIDDFGEGKKLMLKNLILPAITLGIRPLSVILQLTRNSVLEIMSADYIRTARAKGLSQKTILYKHVLKNALNPVISSISGWFASMLAGVVFVEYIFGWKGLGYIIVEALNTYDLPVIMGCVLTISIVFIIVNILVDIIYSLLDPRIKLS